MCLVVLRSHKLATPPVSSYLLHWSLGSMSFYLTCAGFVQRTPCHLFLSENLPGSHCQSADWNLCHSPWSSLRTEKDRRGYDTASIKVDTQAYNKLTFSLDHGGIVISFEKREHRARKWLGRWKEEREGDSERVERGRKERISGSLTFSCIIYAEAYTCRHPGVLNQGRRDKETEVVRDTERKRCKEERGGGLCRIETRLHHQRESH